MSHFLTLFRSQLEWLFVFQLLFFYLFIIIVISCFHNNVHLKGSYFSDVRRLEVVMMSSNLEYRNEVIGFDI